MIDLRHLRYFIAVGEELNFHRAAERVHISQPSLWRRIRDLEALIDVKLFDRQARGVELTESGRYLLSDARKLLAELDASLSRVRLVSKGQAGVLRIAFDEMAARHRALPHYFAAFRAQSPDIDLQLQHMLSQRQFEALEDGHIDAGFVFSRPVDNDSFRHIRIGEVHFLLALPRTHPMAHAYDIGLADLQKHQFVFPSADKNQFLYAKLINACTAAGLVPEIAQHVDNEHTILNLVATGMGLAFVSGLSGEYTPDGVVLRAVQDLRLALNLELVWKTGKPQLDQLVELVQSDPADLQEIEDRVRAEYG